MRASGKSLRAASALLLLALGGWEPFRSPNPEVEAGNKALADGKPDDALSHYDKAAHEGGVDKSGLAYDRGSAEIAKAEHAQDPTERDRLMHRGMDDLKEATGSHDPRIRGLANYNRGNTLLEANKLEESIEAYKNALRDQPGMEDARLNLELALKRRQKQQQQQQGQGKGPPQQGQQGQGQGQGQPQQGQGQQQPQQGQGQQDPQQGQQGQNQQQQQNQQGQGNQQKQQDQQSQGQQRKDHTQPQSPQTPTDGKLDALEQSSRNLQKDGARRRASGRPKDPNKDW